METINMRLIDTHAHLADEVFSETIHDVLSRADQAGLSKILCVGTTAQSSKSSIEIAQRFPQVYASVGIHPNYAHQASEQDWLKIQSLATQNKVVALGETGLDRYWDDCPWENQLENFHRHLKLSETTRLPVIIHSRDCDDEMVEQLKIAAQSGPLRGVMHAFSGSWKMAEACLKLGLYISFAGMVTYKKSVDLRSVAERVPLDRILIETDSPYLSPEPKRSARPNEPALVAHTADFLARSRGIGLKEFAETTSANACKLFDFDGPSLKHSA
jgi:TatD DNase family protein